MLSKAFDDFIISKEDWDAIAAETQQMAQSQQGGAPGASPAQEGGAPQGGGGVLNAVVQALQQLPPPVLQAIGNALAQGIPPQQIFQQLMQAAQQNRGQAA
jgi:hypothetical protein